jgi:hypothetical protein
LEREFDMEIEATLRDLEARLKMLPLAQATAYLDRFERLVPDIRARVEAECRRLDILRALHDAPQPAHAPPVTIDHQVIAAELQKHLADPNRPLPKREEPRPTPGR